MANEKLKTAAKAAGIKQWQLAAALGISEFTFCRWLRFELSDEQKAECFAAIEKMKEGKNGNK